MRTFAAVLACCLSLACRHPAPPPRSGAPTPGPAIVDVGFLEEYGSTYGFSLGKPTSIKVAPAGDTVFFLRSPARSFTRDLYTFDVATGRESVLLTAQQLLGGSAEQVSVEEQARRERQRLVAAGIASYELSRDGKRLLVPLSGRLFVLDRSSDNIIELGSQAGYPLDARFSPDGTKVTCVRDGDLYVTDLATRAERRLTTRSGPNVTNGEAEYVAQEEMNRSAGYWWSPDGRLLAYQQTDTSALEQIRIMDPLHPEAEPQTRRYPRVGTQNAEVRLGLMPVAGGATTWVQWDRARYPYLARVVWSENAPLTLLVQNRAQTEELLLAVDLASGATRVLLRETDPAWVNLDISMPRWLPDGSGFLWSSERSGAWQLELRGRDGALARTLTSADVNYEGLVGFDEATRTAYVVGAAEDASRHLWAVPLDGAPQRLSNERGVHSAVFAEGGGVRVHRFIGPAGAGTWTVEASDGRALAKLTSVAEQPPIELNAEWTVAGPRRFQALILRPRDYVAGRRYPVILSFYGGNSATAERRAAATSLPTSLANPVVPAAVAYFLDQWLADQGFIVVNVDGRGTPGRGRDWERAIHGSFGDVLLADQVEGLQALAARYPEMDMTRVGVYGWSLGGYLAGLAVLRRPDVFHAAVIGAPVTHWHHYNTHYTERYFGLPDAQPEAYERSSLLTYAKNLARPLLIAHGTADDNVFLLHSIKLSNELFRAGKAHDFLPLAGLTHMVPDPVVTRRLHERVVGFFQVHLVEDVPPALPKSNTEFVTQP